LDTKIGYEVKIIKLALVCGSGFPLMVAIPYTLLRWMFPCNSATFLYQSIPEFQQTNLDGVVSVWSPFSLLYLAVICVYHFWLTIQGAGILASFLTSFSVALAYSLRRYIECVTNIAIGRPNRPQIYFSSERHKKSSSYYVNACNAFQNLLRRCMLSVDRQKHKSIHITGLVRRRKFKRKPKTCVI